MVSPKGSVLGRQHLSPNKSPLDHYWQVLHQVYVLPAHHIIWRATLDLFRIYLTTIRPLTTTVDIHLEVLRLVAVIIHGFTLTWHLQKFPVLHQTQILSILKFIHGNIRTCQGCRGSLRASDSSIPDASNDLCIARAEKRPYRDNSGVLVTPSMYKPSH